MAKKIIKILILFSDIENLYRVAVLVGPMKRPDRLRRHSVR